MIPATRESHWFLKPAQSETLSKAYLHFMYVPCGAVELRLNEILILLLYFFGCLRIIRKKLVMLLKIKKVKLSEFLSFNSVRSILDSITHFLEELRVEGGLNEQLFSLF